MFQSIKNAISGKSQKEDTKVKPNSDTKAVSTKATSGLSSFGGMTSAQFKKQLENSGSANSASLAAPKLGSNVLKTLDQYKDNKPKEVIKVASTGSLAEEIATLYSEGGIKAATDMLSSHLNSNRGNVEHRFWYMLMDCHHAANNAAAFEKVALAFAHRFSTSPPSWHHEEGEEKKTMMAGKNIIILEPHFKVEHTEKFKEFLKSAKEEKFCRINVSQCKFDQIELAALIKLHKLFTELRRFQVMSVLMGDNNLINFCKTYINPNVSNKSLKAEFIDNEQIFWLLYLEILQWKGKQEEFENLALDYAMKFEISPPGWEQNGIMSIDKISNSDSDSDESNIVLEKALSLNNIQSLLDIIKADFEKSSKSEIDLINVERIDFSSAGSISHFIQEIWSNEQHVNKKVILKHPNEMILVLLEMVGVTEFVEIVPRKR